MTSSATTSSSSAVIASSSSSSNNHHYILAQRCGGVCEGTLWQTKEKGGGGAGSSVSSSWSIFGCTPEKVYTYSILYGVRLVSYENYMTYERGDMPISIIRIVGASSTAPSATTTITKVSSMLSSRKTTAIASSKYSSSSLAMSTTTTTTTTNTAPAIMDFRIVSDQGTHIHCQTASTTCRNNWLAAIQSALEYQLSNDDTLRSLHQFFFHYAFFHLVM